MIPGPILLIFKGPKNHQNKGAKNG